MQTLFDQITESPAAEFDRRNPLVWIEFERIALELISRGHRHYGAKAIFEVIRFNRDIDITHSAFKLNNDFTPYYARKFIEEYPDHAGFFVTRERKNG